MAILRDLQAVGDCRALPYVEQIAADKTVPPLLREAAQECLQKLQLRKE